MDSWTLRKIKPEDFAAFHAMMSDHDVAKMTMSWPWPPDPAFTRARMKTEAVRSGAVKVIDVNGTFAGQISCVNQEIGYSLARAFWGRGLATWAVQEMLAFGFSDPAVEHIKAGTWEDNPASMRVLEKCGFIKTGEALCFSKARGKSVNGPDFMISRANWKAGLSLHKGSCIAGTTK